MPSMCPICSEEMRPAITFDFLTFEICFDCNYVTEPVKHEFKFEDE